MRFFAPLRMTFSFLLLISFSYGVCSGQTSDDETPKQHKTNLEVFEENILSQLEKYLYYPGLNRDFLFVFSVNPSQGGGNLKRAESETKFIKNIIKKTAESNKLIFSFIQSPEELNLDSNFNLVVLQVYELETTYPGFQKNRFLGEKTLVRNIKIKIGIDMTSSDRKFTMKDVISSDYKDEIGYDDYKKLESPVYEFTKGSAPETGILERLVFPIILITASAAVIILFFTIRTK